MNVLFVSDMDECRGPMARIVCQLHARDMGVTGAGFDSAGIGVMRAAAPPPEVVEFLREQGLNISKHQSRPIAAAQVRWADLILCMTHTIRDRVRTLLGPERAGMVLALNDAVRFGRSGPDKNIEALEAYNQRSLLITFSRIKAATGRLVRSISHGEDSPTDYGGKRAEAGAGQFLDDPHVRQFLSRYILEFIERAFEFPRTEEILEALTVMGRPLSILDLEDLIRTDLGQMVIQEDDGRWRLEEHVRAEMARQRQQRRDEQRRKEAEASEQRTHQQEETRRRRAEEEEKEARREKEEEARREKEQGYTRTSNGAFRNGGNGDEDSGRLDETQALEILAISISTPRGEAARKYKQMLMRFHPDKFHDDDEFRVMAEKKTKRINLAWSLVKDRLPEGE